MFGAILREIFNSLIQKFSKQEILKFFVYYVCAMLLYIVIPLEIKTKIFEQLTDNNDFNLFISVSIIAVILYIAHKIINHTIEKMKYYKIFFKEIESLNDDCLFILSFFYNNNINGFKQRTKILPKLNGRKTLEKLDVIIFCDSFDEDFGFNPNKRQMYMINDEYFNFLNSKKFLKSNSRLMEYIRNDDLL